jgi:DNA repair protein RadC
MGNFQIAMVQLPLVRESTGERVRTPEDVYRVCGDIAHLAQEAFTVLALDVRNRLINRHLVTLAQERLVNSPGQQSRTEGWIAVHR